MIMKTISEIRKELKDIKPYLQKAYSVKDIGMFGSYLRNEQKSDSDLDILVSFHETPSLFKFIKLENYLSDILKMKIDLVMKTALKENLKESILGEVVSL